MRVRSGIGIALAAALLVSLGASAHAQAPASGLKKLAPPLKGPIEVGYMVNAKREGDKIVTVFEVKNLSATGSIIGLQIEQYFYDKAGNPIPGTGDRQRLRQPLQPLEVATITLTSNTVPNMQQPTHKFSYRDGTIKVKPLKTMK